jgi:uncharacterized protein YacL
MVVSLFLSFVAVLCWCLAFSKSLRAKMPTPWWIKGVREEQAEQRLLTEILYRTIGFIGGLVFSVLTIVVLMQQVP